MSYVGAQKPVGQASYAEAHWVLAPLVLAWASTVPSAFGVAAVANDSTFRASMFSFILRISVSPGSVVFVGFGAVGGAAGQGSAREPRCRRSLRSARPSGEGTAPTASIRRAGWSGWCRERGRG